MWKTQNYELSFDLEYSNSKLEMHDLKSSNWKRTFKNTPMSHTDQTSLAKRYILYKALFEAGKFYCIKVAFVCYVMNMSP